ncbi:hypothetical protein GCM10009775_28950 [Microbacterium aoyamense]|uniref:Uncharacterized protein n=1 Tax=Microbacterium aoyamense TaxID=344166 RepID=A0ABP5B7V6_9MICO
MIRWWNAGAKSSSVSACLLVCGAVSDGSISLGLGMKANFDLTLSTGRVANAPTISTAGLSGTCSASAIVGVYGEGGFFMSSQSGTEGALTGGLGSSFGLGGGCALMFNWYL